MFKVLAVAWRDFKHTVLTKAFLIGFLGVPIMLVVGGAVTIYIVTHHQEPPLAGTIGIVDSTGEVAAAARIEFDPTRIEQEERLRLEEQQREMQSRSLAAPDPTAAPDLATAPFVARGDVRIEIESIPQDGLEFSKELDERIFSGELLAIAIFPPTILDAHIADERDVSFKLRVEEHVDSDHISLLERRLARAVVRARADRSNRDVDEIRALLSRPDAVTETLLASGEVRDASKDIRGIRQIVPFIFMMLLWIATFSTGNHLLTSTIEEKSNRVMEVLLSAVSPLQLMTGKILGQGVVGFLITAVYLVLGIVTLFSLRSMELIQTTDLLYFGAYFFMAYFMVASLMAAVGSAVSDIREANSLLTPVMMFLTMIPILWLPISQAPNGVIATTCSFIPPAIPFVMILRLGADEAVPLWQIPVTILWGYACMLGMIWLAAKIFRVGVLMTGKPPSPLELLRWVRLS